jgi:hypothetical protein
MQRLVYRNFGDHQSLVITHSINGPDQRRRPALVRVPAGRFRQPVPLSAEHVRARHQLSLDGKRRDGRPREHRHRLLDSGARRCTRGSASPRAPPAIRWARSGHAESVLINSTAAKGGGNRWEDFATTVVDPSDDATFWYMGDYYKSSSRSIHIGSFRVP